MPQAPQPPLGGGAKSRPVNDPTGRTGRGIPDEAIGPDEPALPETLSLAGDETAEAMARKLEREAASWEAHKRSRRAEGED